MSVKNAILGVVLCGGQSLRMKQDKAMLTYHGKPQWENVFQLLKPYCLDVILSVNDDQKQTWANDLEFALPDMNKFKGNGPIAGFLTAFTTFPLHEYYLLVACDYPNISKNHITLLTSQLDNHFEIITFSQNGQIEPLISIFSQKCVSPLFNYFEKGHTSIQKFILQRHHRLIPLNDQLQLTNINHPNAYTAYIRNSQNHDLQANHIKK